MRSHGVAGAFAAPSGIAGEAASRAQAMADFFQGAVIVVIKWIIAIVLIALAGLVARPWVSRLFNRTEIFNVCQGPEKAGCAGSPHFISCETDVVEWLKSIRPHVCTKEEAKKLTTAPADTCGYTKYEVKCSRR